MFSHEECIITPWIDAISVRKHTHKCVYVFTQRMHPYTIPVSHAPYAVSYSAFFIRKHTQKCVCFLTKNASIQTTHDTNDTRQPRQTNTTTNTTKEQSIASVATALYLHPLSTSKIQKQLVDAITRIEVHITPIDYDQAERRALIP